MPTFDRPPAKATKKNIGNTTDGSSSAGVVATLWIERQATALATCQKRAHVRTSLVRRALDAAAIAAAAITIATPKPSASASPSQPEMMNERMPSIR